MNNIKYFGISLLIIIMIILMHLVYNDIQAKNEYIKQYNELVQELSDAIIVTESCIENNEDTQILLNNKKYIIDKINILTDNQEHLYFKKLHNNIIIVAEQFININDLIIMIINNHDKKTQLELLHCLNNEIIQLNKMSIYTSKTLYNQYEPINFNLNNIYYLLIAKIMGGK